MPVRLSPGLLSPGQAGCLQAGQGIPPAPCVVGKRLLATRSCGQRLFPRGEPLHFYLKIPADFPIAAIAESPADFSNLDFLQNRKEAKMGKVLKLGEDDRGVSAPLPGGREKPKSIR